MIEIFYKAGAFNLFWMKFCEPAIKIENLKAKVRKL